jgi:hypothetical protein
MVSAAGSDVVPHAAFKHSGGAMARRSPQTLGKRQREQAKQEKRERKQQKKAAAAAARSGRPATPERDALLDDPATGESD